MTVITRFAPSPTGFLHIGSARTALFNYLFAKKNNGKFLLRIEDTDTSRNTQEAFDAIINGLKWLGLNWDDEIVYQSKRNELYYKMALELVAQGKAYYCFTPQEEINQAREYATINKQSFIFKSPWRDASPKDYPKNSINPVIRLKVPSEGVTVIHDTLQGDITIENKTLDDMVLVRGNKYATYMLAVVVDDHDMKITHIIRGDDHLTNAARQIALYNAFGFDVPSMTHIPLIHGSDGAKLSKRHGALGIDEYRKMGYLPEGLCNYLLRLGWSHKDEEIFPMDLAISLFDLKGLGVSPARLDFNKMKNINSHYLRNKSNDDLIKIIIDEISHEHKINTQEINCLNKAIESIKLRSELITDLVDLAKIYISSYPLEYSEEASYKIKSTNKEYINDTINFLENISSDFNKNTIQDNFKALAIKHNIKLGDLMQSIRALITGKLHSPSVFEIIEIIGINDSIKRLKRYYTIINT